MAESIEDKCRKHLAKMFNTDKTQWVPNINTGTGYISGRPDAEVRYPPNHHIDVECKGFRGSAFLGDPNSPDLTAGWHHHQRSWWEKMDKPFDSPYFVALLVVSERDPETRVSFEKAGMFLVPPEAWLALEQKLAGRKTVALNPDLERIHANRDTTLESEWPQYRLVYDKQAFHIPESHPLYSILKEHLS